MNDGERVRGCVFSFDKCVATPACLNIIFWWVNNIHHDFTGCTLWRQISLNRSSVYSSSSLPLRSLGRSFHRSTKYWWPKQPCQKNWMKIWMLTCRFIQGKERDWTEISNFLGLIQKNTLKIESQSCLNWPSRLNYEMLCVAALRWKPWWRFVAGNVFSFISITGRGRQVSQLSW